MADKQPDKVLVVDDDARLRGLLQRFLEEQGYLVKAVADGEQMDRALGRELYSIMVLDLMLPGEDGLSICRRLRDAEMEIDRKSTRLNSSHVSNSYAVFCLKKKTDLVGSASDADRRFLFRF